MLYFAYHKKTRPTGRRIADALGIVNQGTLVRREGPIHTTPDWFLIRWGNSRHTTAGHEINSAEAIWRAGDKLASFRCLQAAGVQVPEFREDQAGDAGVWFGRLRRGFGGRDIQIIEGDRNCGAELYTKFIPNNREYRIHVVGDRVVRVQRKYLERPGRDNSQGMIKNHAHGYVFKAPIRPLHKSRTDAAVKAVQALGLDFGAVDLLVDGNGLEYVLEVNTAPACSPRTLQAYVMPLAEMIRTRSNDDYILHPNVDVLEVLHDAE